MSSIQALLRFSHEAWSFARLQVRPTQFHAILSRALPVALRLAASAEPVARQLFQPLVMSLVHWFTRAARRLGMFLDLWNTTMAFDTIISCWSLVNAALST